MRRRVRGRARRRLDYLPPVLARFIGAGVLALVLGLVLVLLRGDPFVASDQGVFLSVAARLLDGDALYSEVFDNKDPLFFYSYAAALWVGGWRGPFLLDAIWLGVAAVSMGLFLRELRAPRVAVLCGFVVYPLALTAGWYLIGLSMLGAVAVAPLVPWLWLRGRFVASGAVLVSAMLMKLNVAPVLAAPLLALVAVGAPDVPRRQAVGRGALGALVAGVAAAAILAARGELRGYLETFLYNVHYSSARTQADGTLERMLEHLRIAWNFFYLPGRWQLAAAFLFLGVFALVLAYLFVTRASRAERALAVAGTVTLAGGLLVVALTAYWYEHLQLLAYPATLMTATLVWRTNEALGGRWAVLAASGAALFALWSTLKVQYGTDVSSLWTSPAISPGGIALERARTRFAPDERSIGYMVFGSNSEGGHAAFIDDAFDLRCRYFHLYTFSLPEHFDETLECAERERPPFVLVTLGFFEPYGDHPEWNAFVAGARRFLEADYELVEREYPGVQVWKLRQG
jgi:hypothetical protein